MTSLRCSLAFSLFVISSFGAKAMDYIGKPDSLIVATTVEKTVPTQTDLQLNSIALVSQQNASQGLVATNQVSQNPLPEPVPREPVKAEQLIVSKPVPVATTLAPGSFLETPEAAVEPENYIAESASIITQAEDNNQVAVISYGSVRDNICTKARLLKGIGYRKGGRDIDGFDCSGFTSYVYGLEDKKIPTSSKSQATLGRKIDLASCQPGDMIFFSHNGRTIAHVGIVTKNDGDRLLVIHSTSSRGIIEQDVLKSAYWSKRIMFARNVIDN